MSRVEEKEKIVLPDMYGEVQPFSISITDWMEKHGFLVRDTWNSRTGKWGSSGWMELQPIQKDILGYALQQNEENEFRYSTVLYSTTKKSGKTAGGAALAAYYAEVCPAGSEIYIIANDIDQAEGRMMRDLKYHAASREYKVNKYEVVLPNETIIQVLAQSYKSVAGSRHALVLFDELWGITCVDTQTECYTKQGWKKHNELSVGDVIATINPETLLFEWQPVKKVIRQHHSGHMCSFSHRRVNMLLTPNHRVLAKFRNSGNTKLDDSEYEFKQAGLAVFSYEMRMPTTSGFSGELPSKIVIPSYVYETITKREEYKDREFDINPFLRLLGIYLAEGNVIYYKWNKLKVPSGIGIAQRYDKHPDEYERIQNTLDELGLEYSCDGRGFRIYDKQLAAYFDRYGKSYDKYIPQEIKDLDDSLLLELFEAFMDGDGWRAGKGWQTELASERLINDLMEIGLKLGYIPKYMGKRFRVVKNENKAHWMYRISFSLGNITLDKRNMSVVNDWSGEVWCPSVDNTTWLARRDGTVWWTGNTELTRRTYEEMTPIPTIPWSLRFIATYAGFINESDLLWDIYLNGVGKEEHEDGRAKPLFELADYPCWENGKQFTYWNHEPTMPWQTTQYYEEQRESLRPAAYLRLHENRWVTTHEEFIPMDWWEYASSQIQDSAELWKEHPYAKFPLYLGIDAAPKRDSTALVACCYDSSKGVVVDVLHKIWTPTNEQLDLDATLKQMIIKLYTEFKVVDISYDPAHLYQLMLQLEQMGYPVSEFTQTTGNMVKASQNLYDLLKFKRLHSYKDEEARTHIQNTVAQSETNGFRIVKQKQTSKGIRKPMDYSVALSIAAYKAVQGGGVDVSIPVHISYPFSDKGDPDTVNSKLPWMFRS